MDQGYRLFTSIAVEEFQSLVTHQADIESYHSFTQYTLLFKPVKFLHTKRFYIKSDPQQPVQISNRKLQSKSKRSTQCRYTTPVATQSGTLKCPSLWSSQVRVMPASCCYLGRPIQTQPRHHNNNLDQVTPQVQATAANKSVQISEPTVHFQFF